MTDVVYMLCSGYAADDVTHCIRPEDVKSRRAVVVLRRFDLVTGHLELLWFYDLIRNETV